VKGLRQRIVIPRKVLLVEIERRCREPHCNARARLGLTKEEARVYQGFECEQCESWNEDALTEKDVPDWWEELQVTDLYAVRERQAGAAYEPGEVVKRMSEAYKHIQEAEAKGEGQDGMNN
jgi:hypothetical protein